MVILLCWSVIAPHRKAHFHNSVIAQYYCLTMLIIVSSAAGYNITSRLV